MLSWPYERFDLKLIILTEHSRQGGFALTRALVVGRIEQLTIYVDACTPGRVLTTRIW